MKKILSVSVFLALLISLAADVPKTFACSCAVSESPRVSMEKSTAVFAGRVTEIIPPSSVNNRVSSADENKITFDVSMVWKGIDRGPVQIFSAMSSASCGYEFEEGKEYLVYAYEDEDRLTTGLCTRTALLADAGEDLAALGAGETVTPNGANDEEVASETNLIIPVAALLAVAAIAYYLLKGKKKATVL